MKFIKCLNKKASLVLSIPKKNSKKAKGKSKTTP